MSTGILRRSMIVDVSKICPLPGQCASLLPMVSLSPLLITNPFHIIVMHQSRHSLTFSREFALELRFKFLAPSPYILGDNHRGQRILLLIHRVLETRGRGIAGQVLFEPFVLSEKL